MGGRVEVDVAVDAGVQRDLKGTREVENARAPLICRRGRHCCAAEADLASAPGWPRSVLMLFFLRNLGDQGRVELSRFRLACRSVRRLKLHSCVCRFPIVLPPLQNVGRTIRGITVREGDTESDVAGSYVRPKNTHVPSCHTKFL